MTHATLGFVFTADLKKVLLIKKSRPHWQVGKINGLGGKCEGEESVEDCISREVSEEANLKIPPKKWKKIATLSWQEWNVTILTAIWSGSLKEAESLTDEQVSWCKVAQLPQNVMSNLTWLIPLSIDKLTTPELATVEVHYT